MPQFQDDPLACTFPERAHFLSRFFFMVSSSTKVRDCVLLLFFFANAVAARAEGQSLSAIAGLGSGTDPLTYIVILEGEPSAASFLRARDTRGVRPDATPSAPAEAAAA